MQDYVELDLNKPLVAKVFIGGRWQIVEYEGLRMVCFHCGKFGHNDESCQAKQREQEGHTEEEAMNITQKNAIQEKDYKSARYGPWMVAKRYTRQNTSSRIKGKIEVGTSKNQKKVSKQDVQRIRPAGIKVCFIR